VSFHDEEITRGGGLRAPLRAVSQPPESDDLVNLGQVMTAVVGLQVRTARMDQRLRTLATLPSEVHALRQEIQDDRHALVTGASKHAAAHSSNRMAALMGALFTLYEIAGPYLHDLWRMVRK
jgi:hypothetical protein